METERIVTDRGLNINIRDIDLIDILWRQDIDMGCGKEVFDVNLRRELEKEQEIEIQKQQHKRDELEYSRRKMEEEKRRLEEQWLTDNFMQDGETGEWIPLTSNPPLLDQAQQDLLCSSGTEDYCLDAALNLLQGEPSNPLVDIPEYANTTDQQNDVENLVEEAEKYMTQTQEPLAPVPLQNALEECWQDLVSVLNLTGSGNMMAYLNSTAAAAEASIVPEATGLIQNATLPSVTNDSSVLLQNATMPAVQEPAVATLGGYNSAMFLPQLMQFNSSMPGYGSQLQLDWEPSDLMFGNVTSPGNDSILDEVEQFLPTMLSDATEMSYLDLTNDGDFANIPELDDSGSDSAISLSGSNSPSQEMTDMDVASLSPYDGMVGATGGSDYGSSSGSSKSLKYDPDEYDYSFGTYQYSNSENGSHSNFSSTNDTKFNSQSDAENVQHNHTYPLQSKTDLKFNRKIDRPKQKGPQSRDEKRVMDMKIPFTLGQIVGTPVDEFNEMMTKYKLSDPQMQLVRDIRRRGKNKVAAQNCRKRKMSVITNIEDDVESLAEKKERLLRERQEIEQETRAVKEDFGHLYREIFHSLRDEQGEPYSPHEYSLQQTSDGNVFLVPRNNSVDTGDKDKANKRRKSGSGKKRL